MNKIFFKVLPKRFYERSSSEVARDLLGKLIVRKINNNLLIARIVETEAYHGLKDPASRAFTTPKMAQAMWSHPGQVFVYMVHNNWLFNIITDKNGIPSAVLIRAAEPIENVEVMIKNRGFNFKKEDLNLTNGPGKLSEALKIEKLHNGVKVYNPDSELSIAESISKEEFRISSSHRIGVKRDLKEKLRFYIENNKWVSKGKVISEFKRLYL